MPCTGKQKAMIQFITGLYYLTNIALSQYVNSSSEYSHNIIKRNVDIQESTMTTPLLIQKYGYPSELYHLNTPDDYVLEIHRIPYGKKSPPCRHRTKPPVLLMHDIISSSSDFIINGPNKSLAYILADNGYDVWMGNVRGNRYSRNHKQLNPGSNNFWDFTFHEMGTKDLPTKIDFILEKTGQNKLFYIGHSMGSTIYYVLLSEHPEYNTKIQAAFHMSPVVYLSYIKSPILRFFATFTNPISLFLDIIGVGEFLPRWEFLNQIGRYMCKGEDYTLAICSNVLFILSGYNQDNLDLSRFPIYMGHTPAGASTKTFIHYGQIVQTGVFRKFNWGIMENYMKYGSLKPPEYLLRNNQVPIYLFCSSSDWFAGNDDVDYLYKQLPPGIATKFQVPDPGFAHVDFVFGKNAKEVVYDNLIPILKKYTA